MEQENDISLFALQISQTTELITFTLHVVQFSSYRKEF